MGIEKGVSMKIGIISDSHEDRQKMLPEVINKLITKEKVEIFFHAGDIFAEHLDAKLFQGLPVVCALTNDDYERHQIGENHDKKNLAAPSDKWTFTHPYMEGDRTEFSGRIVDMDVSVGVKFRIYLGHKRWDDYSYGPESELIKTIDIIRRQHDSIRYFIAGHHHRQLFIKFSLITCINPGAIQDSAGVFGGYEYAVIDTETDTVIFDRIQARTSEKNTLKLGIISDTLEISEHNKDYWKNLGEIFKSHEITDIIHCGNIAPRDIGHTALKKFQIYCNPNLGIDNERKSIPKNWHLQEDKGFGQDNIPVEIKDYSFLIRLKLGAQMWDQSGFAMHRETLGVKTDHPNTRIVLCGSSRQTIYIEDEEMAFINPGCALLDQSFSIIELPRGRLTFGKIPINYQS